jgi:hypothetical protein
MPRTKITSAFKAPAPDKLQDKREVQEKMKQMVVVQQDNAGPHIKESYSTWIHEEFEALGWMYVLTSNSLL